MGARGKLKLPPHLSVVDPDDDVALTAADTTPAGKPEHPAGWREVDESTLAELWNQYVAELGDAQLLAKVDGMTLELALRHFLAARQASDELADGEVLVEDRGGAMKKNPAGAEFRQQSALFLEYAKQMGMSFAARARIDLRRPEDGQGELFGAASGAR